MMAQGLLLKYLITRVRDRDMRETGFYWIKYDGVWTIGIWEAETFTDTQSFNVFDEQDLDEVKEDRIEPPE